MVNALLDAVEDEVRAGLFPMPERHCLSCRHCVLMIKPPPKTPVFAIPLTYKKTDSVPIKCRLELWPETIQGAVKTYKSPFTASKSRVLKEMAERCSEYDPEP